MNIYKVIFYYIGIIIVCIVFINMLYNLVTKKYKEKLSKEQLSKNPKIQYFQTCFYIAGIIFSGICVCTIGVSGIRDLPFVLKNQYPNEITKEKLDIGFIHKNLKEGEKVEVYYLPHLKIGSIYKIQQ